MVRNNQITLIKRTYIKDQYGVEKPHEVYRSVFCNIASVTLTEISTAGINGLRPEYKCEMFSHDYEGENIAKIGDSEFTIYRTYLGRNETLDLYLARRTSNG